MSEGEGVASGYTLLGPWTSPDALEQWFQSTRAWTPAMWPTLPQPQVVVRDLIAAIAGRFAGRALTIDVGGHPVELVLEAVAVDDPPDGQPGCEPAVKTAAASRWPWPIPSPPASLPDVFGWWRDAMRIPRPSLPRAPKLQRALRHVRVDATDVRVEGALVGAVSATAEQVRIEPGRQPQLVTGPVDLVVRSTRAAVAAFLSRRDPRRRFDPRADGLVRISQPGRRIALIVRPQVTGRLVHVDVVGIAVFGRELAIPKRLVRRRTFRIPPLAEGVELVDVEERDGVVLARLRHPGVREPIPLDRVREAIRAGAARLTLRA